MLEDKCFSSFYIPSMSGHMFLCRRFFFFVAKLILVTRLKTNKNQLIEKSSSMCVTLQLYACCTIGLDNKTMVIIITIIATFSIYLHF